MDKFYLAHLVSPLILAEKTKEELIDLLITYQKAIDIHIISSITDEKGLIVYVNEKFCQVSKYSREELIGKSHNIINSRSHSPAFFSNLWKTIKAGQVWHDEIKNKAKDGSYYWVDSVIIPVKNNKNEIKFYLSLRLLITDKKNAAEAEKKENLQNLNDVLQMTSHKVRSPIATCLGLINIIEKDKEMSKNELNSIISYLKSNIKNLDSYTKDLTKFVNEWEFKYNKNIK